MNWKSTAGRYGAVAIGIHWIAAALIAALLGSGFRAAGMADPAGKADVLRAHVVLGLSILSITLLRVAWWWLADRRPRDPATTPRWQQRTAHAVKTLFYVIVFGMAASGIGMLLLSGAGTILFGKARLPLPDLSFYAPHAPHVIGAWLMLGLFVLHAGAALYHQFVLRDRLLARMGIGRRL